MSNVLVVMVTVQNHTRKTSRTCIGSWQSQSLPPRAFTLLEVLLALGLSLLLMTVLLTAVELYRSVSSAGRNDVEQAQLARAILRMMELDLRSCTFRKPESDTGNETDEDDEDTKETMVTAADPAEATEGESIGIFGDSTMLVIQTRSPSHRLGSSLPFITNPNTGGTSDLKSVAYFLAVPEAGGLPGAVGDLLATTNGEAGRGLARLEGDRLSLEFAETTGNLQTLAENTKLLAGEVHALGFRYFDGLIWQDLWDSVAYERLPKAVEIRLEFRLTGTVNTASAETGLETPPSRRYRFVVALPAAEPAITTTDGTSFLTE